MLENNIVGSNRYVVACVFLSYTPHRETSLPSSVQGFATPLLWSSRACSAPYRKTSLATPFRYSVCCC